jgi:hypothetical protein
VDDVGILLGSPVGRLDGCAEEIAEGAQDGCTVGGTLGVTLGITEGAQDGCTVGGKVGITLGITVGAQDGCTVGGTLGVLVDIVTLRTRLLLLSAIYTLPDASSTTQYGLFNVADVAAPLSPL